MSDIQPTYQPLAPSDASAIAASAPVGRPTLLTPACVNLIIERIADGESLRSVCRDESMPSKATVMRWACDNQEFRDLYARAMLERADSHQDDVVDIADDGRNDWMENNDPDNPGYKFNGEHVQRSKLRVDARKWAAAKLNPRKYGEKTELALTGPNGGPVATVGLQTTDPVAAAAAYQEMLKGGGDER